LLFADIAASSSIDACTDPACYQAKLDGFVKQSIAAKPKLVQISSAYGPATEGSAALPRNKYVEIRPQTDSGKPTNQKQRDWPEYKTCKFTTEAIVIEGTEKGEIRTICANPECTIHHARKQKPATDAAFKAEQGSVRNSEQRKMFVTFHRAVCPDGFSLDFDKYIGLDPLGTTGLATKVNHGYLMAFGAATAIGGLGGLAQIGNNSSVLDSSTQIRNGISEQTAAEGEQVLNHFLTGVNRQWITHSVDVQTPIRSTENETNRFELLDPAASGS
jgi:hypothetical protein